MTILATSLALAAADDQWRDQALCRNTDPDLFFPVGTTGMALVQVEHANRVCGQCTVSAACLDFALATNQDSGIWGGLVGGGAAGHPSRKRAAALRATAV